MTAAGVAKLIEECGELVQVCGKRLAYWTTDEHPDGTNLRERMEDEMGDVLAAIEFVTDQLGLDADRIERRTTEKHMQFRVWDALTDNNEHAIDRRPA